MPVHDGNGEDAGGQKGFGALVARCGFATPSLHPAKHYPDASPVDIEPRRRDARGTQAKPLGVTSCVIVDALPEKLGLLALPVLEGGDGRSALQG